MRQSIHDVPDKLHSVPSSRCLHILNGLDMEQCKHVRHYDVDVGCHNRSNVSCREMSTVTVTMKRRAAIISVGALLVILSGSVYMNIDTLRESSRLNTALSEKGTVILSPDLTGC